MNLQQTIRRILMENMNVKFYLLRRYDYDELNNILQNSLQTQSRNLKHYKDKTFNYFNNAVVRSMTERIGEELTDGWIEDLPIPENEIYDFVESLFKDEIIKKYDDLVLNDMNLQENIRRILREELNNRGDCNITYVPEQQSKLDRFSNLWDMVVNDINELIDAFKLEKQSLPKEVKVYSVQEKFDTEYVKRIDDERYNKSDISLLKYKNKLYIINGHHRLCYDRINNRDSYVYIFDKNDSELVDCIFYGIGNC